MKDEESRGGQFVHQLCERSHAFYSAALLYMGADLCVDLPDQ